MKKDNIDDLNEPIEEQKEKDSLATVVYDQALYIHKLEELIQQQRQLIQTYQSALINGYQEHRSQYPPPPQRFW